MKPPTLDSYKQARRRLRTVVVPAGPVPMETDPGEPEVWLKPEIHQRVHSFKIRGVYNAVAALPEEVRGRGLSTVSAGNTAQALAWCGRHFGVPARSLMPESAPAGKVAAVRALGGMPVLVPVDELFRYMQERGWEREPHAFVHPWTSLDLRLGHGSLGLELAEELPALSTVFVPVGGGGLLAGVAGALDRVAPGVRIVAVEPEGCASFHAARAAGRPVTVECRTACDGVAVPFITDEMFPLLDGLVDDAVLVSEERVTEVLRRLALRDKMVVEPSGALAAAAALAHPWAHSGPAVALVTGGSIDGDRLAAILAGGRVDR